MKVIKSAIIGAGVMGNQFANMFMLPEFELSIVCDSHQEKADHLAAKYNAKATTDINQIIADPSIELVYIAVPPRLHLEITRPIIQAQKHVIAEKPLSVTLEEAAELVSLSNSTILNGKKGDIDLVSFKEAENVMRIINSILYNQNFVSK